VLGPDLSVLIFIGTLPTLLCNIPPLPPVSLWGPLAGCVCLDEAMYTKYWRGECTVYSHAYCTHALCLYTGDWFVYTTDPPPPLLSAFVQSVLSQLLLKQGGIKSEALHLYKCCFSDPGQPLFKVMYYQLLYCTFSNSRLGAHSIKRICLWSQGPRGPLV
jgi:hypothetical protein